METKQLIKKEVKLRQPNTDFNDLSETTPGQVEEIIEDELVINLEEASDFEVEDLIQVIYVDNVKGIHYFNTEVKNKDELIIKMQVPEQLQKFQRRNYLRVQYETEIEFSPISYKGENLTHLEEKKGFGKMIDISAGGICFISDIELMKELVIEIRFELGEKQFQVLGEVVRVIVQEEEYEMGIKFDLRSEKVENQISNFVLQQQIKNRRRQKQANS